MTTRLFLWQMCLCYLIDVSEYDSFISLYHIHKRKREKERERTLLTLFGISSQFLWTGNSDDLSLSPQLGDVFPTEFHSIKKKLKYMKAIFHKDIQHKEQFYGSSVSYWSFVMAVIHLGGYGGCHSSWWVWWVSFILVGVVGVIHLGGCGGCHSSWWVWWVSFILVGVVGVIHLGGCGGCHSSWWVWWVSFILVGVVGVIHLGGCGGCHSTCGLADWQYSWVVKN